MADELGEWVEKDAFVMPVLPASLAVDPLLAALLHLTAFLELSGDRTVDPDRAVEAMEHVGHYLQQFPPERRDDIRAQVNLVAEHARRHKWGEAVVEFFREFFENFGLSESAG
jgi:hypothetical protein